MKTRLPLALTIMTLNTLFLSITTQAAAPSATFELGGGVEQDSNLHVVELDKSSNESDMAAVLNAKADAQWKPSDKFTLNGGYAYSTKHYQDNDSFNLTINQLSADANYDFSVITLGTNYNFADAELDNKSFLELRQTSLYASKLFSDRIYLRAASNFQDKSFNHLADRNASNKGLSADIFVFFNDAKTFLSFGIANENENANAKQFDYKGVTLKSKVSNKFSLFGEDNKLQLGWRYFTHDYSNVTPEIHAERYDTGHTTDIEWEIALTAHIVAIAKAEYSQYHSNLAAADYSDTRTSLTLKARF